MPACETWSLVYPLFIYHRHKRPRTQVHVVLSCAATSFRYCFEQRQGQERNELMAAAALSGVAVTSENLSSFFFVPGRLRLQIETCDN